MLLNVKYQKIVVFYLNIVHANVWVNIKQKKGNVKTNCANCDKEIVVCLNQYKEGQNFCSHSCSATYNNKKRDKEIYEKISNSNIKQYWGSESKNKIKEKSKQTICPICGGKKCKRAKKCKICNGILERTLGSYIKNRKYKTRYLTSIRKHAIKVMNNIDKKDKVCEYCHNHEFDDVLQVHHIKGILKFENSDKVKDINSESNLMWLCPNHHAMVEKNLIKINSHTPQLEGWVSG